MKKKIAMLLAMVMTLSLGGMTASAAEPLMDEPMTFKVCFAETEDSIFGSVMIKAFEKISEETNNELKFEIYANNQLGSITDMAEQMKAGAPLICSLGFDNLGDMVPDFAPASFPYIYKDLYEVQKLGKSDWMADKEAKLRDQDVVPLCYGAQGYRHFIGTFEINSAADMNGHIVRMGPSSAAQGFITVMGGSPTTSTWADNYSLIQTGVIEACEAPLSLLLSSSLNEVCDYLSLSGHFVNPLALCINPMFWDQIPEEYQEMVKTVLDEACTEMEDTAMANEEDYIQQFKDAGVTVTEPDKASFEAYVPALFEELDLDPAIYDDIRAAIDAAE